MKTVAITGGIGSGKSVVCKILKYLGYKIYDTDSNAKELMNSDPNIKEALKLRYTNDIYTPTGLNRERLANIIFNNREELEAINQIVHPVVKHHFLKWVEGMQGDLCFIESAIIYEAKFNHIVDEVWTISAPIDIRVKRVVERNAVSESEAISRVTSQMSDTKREELADYIIVNDNKTPILPQIEKILAI